MKFNLLVFQKFCSKIGNYVFNFFCDIGDVFFFFLLFVKNLLTDKFYFRLFFDQVFKIGFNSLPVVGLTAIFTGMVLALQSYTGFSRFSAESASLEGQHNLGKWKIAAQRWCVMSLILALPWIGCAKICGSVWQRQHKTAQSCQ